MLIRVVEGEVKIGQKVRLWWNQKEFEVQELGVIAPHPQAVKSLMAGEVGIFVANVKELADAKVGDTITDAVRPTTTPFPGFKEVKPMVFSGIFPIDAAEYDNLRDALTKLRLNDSAFTWEPETSTALGFGFRCGYLGLLHMEIVQERLEREYNLNLISTAPSVVYKIFPNGGEPFLIDNPAKLPPVQNIEHLEEPYLICHIHVPNEHLGAILGLCQDRRGIQKAIDYLGSTGTRCRVTYEMPLAEVVFDFFDKMKSVSRGYASLDYELGGYKTSDLVRVDILINGEIVDALSIIVHKDARVSARPRGLREAQGSDPQADVRGRHPGGDRQPDHQPRDHLRHAQERAGQVLRRRHLAQAQAPREAEGGQEAHEAGRQRRAPPGGLPRRAEVGGLTWPPKPSRWS